MKRFVVAGAGILLFLAGILAGRGLYRVLTDTAAAIEARRRDSVWNGNELTVHGTKTRFDIPDAENVEVTHSPDWGINDDQVLVDMLVTIRGEHGLVLTKKAYEAVQEGMNYPQVGEALGGVMRKGQMSPGFSGDIVIVQGKRRLLLRWNYGNLTGKAGTNLD